MKFRIFGIVVGSLLGATVAGHWLQVENNSPYPVHVEWKRVYFLGDTNWNELHQPGAHKRQGIGGWCTKRVNITPVIDGKNAGVITLNTPGSDCQSFRLVLSARDGNFSATVHPGGVDLGAGALKVGDSNGRSVSIEALKRDEKFQD